MIRTKPLPRPISGSRHSTAIRMAARHGSRSYSAIAASSDAAKGRTHLETRALLGATRTRSDLPQPDRRFICELAAAAPKPYPRHRNAVCGVGHKHSGLFPRHLRCKGHLLARAIELLGRGGFSVGPPQGACLI